MQSIHSPKADRSIGRSMVKSRSLSRAVSPALARGSISRSCVLCRIRGNGGKEQERLWRVVNSIAQESLVARPLGPFISLLYKPGVGFLARHSARRLEGSAPLSRALKPHRTADRHLPSFVPFVRSFSPASQPSASPSSAHPLPPSLVVALCPRLRLEPAPR